MKGHFVGRLSNGTIFDSTREREKELSFMFGDHLMSDFVLHDLLTENG